MYGTVHSTYKHIGYQHNLLICTVGVWSRYETKPIQCKSTTHYYKHKPYRRNSATSTGFILATCIDVDYFEFVYKCVPLPVGIFADDFQCYVSVDEPLQTVEPETDADICLEVQAARPVNANSANP